MPTYLSPGVYVEELEAGSRPIEGVGTAVAAFVGLAEKGPVNEPTLVSNWTQFAETFGDFQPSSYLAHSVYGYFLNGGGNCYVVRIGADGGGPDSRRPKQAPTKELPAAATAAVGPYRVTAIPGAADARANHARHGRPVHVRSPPVTRVPCTCEPEGTRRTCEPRPSRASDARAIAASEVRRRRGRC